MISKKGSRRYRSTQKVNTVLTVCRDPTWLIFVAVQQENMLEVIKFQKDFAAAQPNRYRTTTRYHLLAWLDPQKIDERRLKTLLETRTSQTGLWIFQNQAFTEWVAMKGSNIFWIRGVAGAGKSVLCAQIIEHVASRILKGKNDEPQGRPVLYHFCDFSNIKTTQLVGILASVLSQLLTFRPDYKFSKKYERLLDAKQQEGPLNDAAFFYDIECMIVKIGTPFYLFIDGLDECEDRNGIIGVLDKLVENLGAFILVASRDEVDLRNGLQDASVLQLDRKILEPDIALFVRDETARLVREKKLRTRDPKLPAVIECQLAERSNGV
jgi:NACHT domain